MYQLIAFDMDGTLLNSKKEITEGSKAAIKEAEQAGKIIILNTGRCMAELTEHLKILPEVRYLNCVSGAMVMDVKKNRVIYSRLLDIDTVKEIIKIATQEDTMIHMLLEDSIVQKSCWENMERYGMGIYKGMFAQVAKRCDDIVEEFFANPFPLGKINIYHTDTEARERTKQRLKAADLPISYVNSEQTSVEVSARGVDKGIGLRKLCQALDLPIEQTIVVGDADNDIEALKVAGLAVAMGNANDKVKNMSDVVVADCDHEGCAEVVEKYLLGSEERDS